MHAYGGKALKSPNFNIANTNGEQFRQIFNARQSYPLYGIVNATCWKNGDEAR